MPNIPKRVEERLISGVKKFQSLLATAKSRDVNEADTVVILNDVFAEIFGYDKYFEVTAELSIRGTFCDLAIKLDGKIHTLVEAKAVGIELKDQHVKQAIDYAANQGIDWVVLTNGICWRIYRVVFAKPIDQELVCEFDLLKINPKSEDDLYQLFLLTREGWSKSAVHDFHQQHQALSRFSIAAAMMTDPALSVIRRELKRVSPDVRIDADDIMRVLSAEVIKREILESDKFQDARKAINRAASKALRTRKEEEQVPPIELKVVTSDPTSSPSAPINNVSSSG